MSAPRRRYGDAQREALEWIDAWIEMAGYPPSLRDLAGMLGAASVSGVQEVLTRLERHGLIRRTPGVARSIVITDAGRSALGSREPGRAAPPPEGSDATPSLSSLPRPEVKP